MGNRLWKRGISLRSVVALHWAAFSALSLLLIPLNMAAQDKPRVEVFGGYSYLHVGEQPDSLLAAAGLNGWNTSLKLNLRSRIGLLADFGGNYGQRGLTPYTIESPAQPGQLTRISAKPSDMRQHTFLFGTEVLALRRGRLIVNVRALAGVAHANALVFHVEPEPGSSLPPFTRTFPSASRFAASFGASVDYRITDRVSYRVIQPELLLTRSGTETSGSSNHYNFRLSTGLVFTSGDSSSHRSSGRQFSFGVMGGAALTDAFGHETTGYIILPNGQIQPTRSRSYSTLKDYVIGPMIEAGPPCRGLSVEFDALYRPMNLTMASVGSDGSLSSISPATVVTWEFPLLVRYRFGSGLLKPFIEAGPSFRASGNLNDAEPSAYGGTAGLGVEAQMRKLRIGPVLRYTHWAADADYAGSRTKRNQVELLLGVSF